MKKVIGFILVTLLLVSFSKTESNPCVNNKNGIGLSKYDAVSYFTGKEPQLGKEQFWVKYNHITYYFSSEEHKIRFEKNPKQFLPQYGGWCAYAMGLEDYKNVFINPKTYKIINRKLYLFYNKLGVNTLDDWNKSEESYLKRADENWTKIIKENKC